MSVPQSRDGRPSEPLAGNVRFTLIPVAEFGPGL